MGFLSYYGRMNSQGTRQARSDERHVLGLSEWTAWFDLAARRIFGMSGDDFERQYTNGIIGKSGEAEDLASMLPLIVRLRERDKFAVRP